MFTVTIFTLIFIINLLPGMNIKIVLFVKVLEDNIITFQDSLSVKHLNFIKYFL